MLVGSGSVSDYCVHRLKVPVVVHKSAGEAAAASTSEEPAAQVQEEVPQDTH